MAEWCGEGETGRTFPRLGIWETQPGAPMMSVCLTQPQQFTVHSKPSVRPEGGWRKPPVVYSQGLGKGDVFSLEVFQR